MKKLITLHQLAHGGIPANWDAVIFHRTVVHMLMAFAAIGVISVVCTISLKGMFELAMFYSIAFAVVLVYAASEYSKASVERLRKKLKQQHRDAIHASYEHGPEEHNAMIREINELREVMGEAHEAEQVLLQQFHTRLRLVYLQHLAVELGVEEDVVGSSS